MLRKVTYLRNAAVDDRAVPTKSCALCAFYKRRSAMFGVGAKTSLYFRFSEFLLKALFSRRDQCLTETAAANYVACRYLWSTTTF